MIRQILLKSFYRVLTGLLLMIIVTGFCRADETAPDPFGLPDPAMLKSTPAQGLPGSAKPAAPISLEEARRVSSIPPVPTLTDLRSPYFLPEEKEALPTQKASAPSPEVPVPAAPPVKAEIPVQVVVPEAAATAVQKKNPAPEETAESAADVTRPVGSSIEGIYDTSFNQMSLHLNGNQVTGTYKFKGGKIEGRLKGNRLVGTWTQSNGKGRIEFVFTDDFSSFTGKWSYNDNPPNSKWNGQKKGAGN